MSVNIAGIPGGWQSQRILGWESFLNFLLWWKIGTLLRRFKNIGPGAMVAAAFIGPGTITTASLAGAQFGYCLLWAVVFATFSTVVLQEMAARLGLVGQLGLGEAIRIKSRGAVGRFLAVLLVVGAIFLGNAAYEAGNLSGAVLGWNHFQFEFFGNRAGVLLPLVGLIAFGLLYSGTFPFIEKFLIGLVALMSLVFFITAFLVAKEFPEMAEGLLVPKVPENGWLVTLGLIGTTIVPYNLFLHASAVQRKWKGAENLTTARWDTIISVILGGMITMAVVITAAATKGSGTGQPASLGDLATQLQPLLGNGSYMFLSLGFLAAGLSSAVTAPLAAAFATTGVLGWNSDMKGTAFRMVWMAVLLAGLIFSMMGIKPIRLILLAQVANGILLPVMVAFLLWVMNDACLMGASRNNLFRNISGILILLVTLILGSKQIFSVFSSF